MGLNDIANLIAVTAVIPLSAFIFYYATELVPGRKYLRRYSSRWKTTQIGRILMYQKVSFLLFLLFVLVGIFTEPYPAESYIRLFVYGVLVVLFWRVFFVLRKVQKTPPAPTQPVMVIHRTEQSEGDNSAAGAPKDQQTGEIPVVIDISATDSK